MRFFQALLIAAILSGVLMTPALACGPMEFDGPQLYTSIEDDAAAAMAQYAQPPLRPKDRAISLFLRVANPVGSAVERAYQRFFQPEPFLVG